MIREENEFVIDQLIQEGRSFALWRIPGEETIHFRMQTTGSPDLIYDLSALNGRSGFVIAPFHVSTEHPIVLIQPDCFELPEKTKASSPENIGMFARKEYDVSDKAKAWNQYQVAFQHFWSALDAKKAEKLVLSRSFTLKKTERLSPGKAFFRACRHYVYSYVYLCHTPQTGTWIGGTPEILLSGEGKQWQTIALAGTQHLSNGRLPRPWDEKNMREQQLVATYIREQLEKKGIHPEEQGPYSAVAVELAHLRSDFRFELPDTQHLGDLLDLLHPTPAVCGFPKEIAHRFILEREGYDRSYYSGFVGWLSPVGRTDLYVNLRCATMQDHCYTLFAGGGLLPSSCLQEEWQETNDKMQTMKKIIE